jgi:hypothetical protein
LLDDAVAAFLDSVSERALDEPLLALLRSEGFSHVHLTHGQAEFGKDVIGRRDGEQWAFQSKAGDIGQPQWRTLAGQLDELRLSSYTGPNFDAALPRHPVLVTTGRLVGNAPLLAREYNERARERGEPELEVWTRDDLLARLSSNPNAVLRGSIDGQLLALLGGIDRGDVSMDLAEQFSRRWDAFPPENILGLGIVEAAIVCDRLKAAERIDLACHVALCMVRAAWAGTRSDADAQVVADAAGTLFETYGSMLWAECDDRLLRKRGLVGYSGFAAWATYPVRAMRVAELTALLALRAAGQNRELETSIAKWVSKFVTAQPGTAHPIGDRYAVSLIPPALLLAQHHSGAARRLLRQATIWLCDRHERFSFGLAPSGASAADEIGRTFGDMFEHIPLRRRHVSQVAAVLLDLAALLRYRKLYGDIRNDQLAVDVTPMVLRCPDSADQYMLTGLGNRWELNPAYPDELPRKATVGAPHFNEDAASRQLLRLDRPWDLLAVSSALRDRHFVGAMRAFAG